jgi:hypothetical protein
MNDELKGRPHISLKRKLLKIAVMGRRYTSKEIMTKFVLQLFLIDGSYQQQAFIISII